MNQNSASTHTHPVTRPDAGAAATLHAIRFPRGLHGFEACRSFVLMASGADPMLQYLKSVEGPPASFLVIDPRRVMPGYGCELTDTDRHQLGADINDRALLWLALVMVEPDGTVTANLRAPIVINPALMIGQQVIPYHCGYSLRHVLVDAE